MSQLATFKRAPLADELALRDAITTARIDGEQVQWGASLGLLTWYKTGGHSQALVRVETTAQLCALLDNLTKANIPWHILGSGANLLVPEGIVPGAVLQLDGPDFRYLKIDTESAQVEVGAGHNLQELIRKTTLEGLQGLEGLAGIPASIGGAVAMNAGGKHGEICDCLIEVQVCDAFGNIYWLAKDTCGFGYRHNQIEEPWILAVRFQLHPVVEKRPLIEQMKAIYKDKTSSQPLSGRSAGCSWKNPPKDATLADGTWCPAGMLVDKAGLKGYRHDTAQISDIHANFIVLDRINGKAIDVLSVLAHAEETVKQKFGITLQREVVIW